jgi:hypothetical protein
VRPAHRPTFSSSAGRKKGVRGESCDRIWRRRRGGEVTEEDVEGEDEEDEEEGLFKAKAMNELDAGGGVRSYLQAKYLGSLVTRLRSP